MKELAIQMNPWLRLSISLPAVSNKSRLHILLKQTITNTNLTLIQFRLGTVQYLQPRNSVVDCLKIHLT